MSFLRRTKPTRLEPTIGGFSLEELEAALQSVPADELPALLPPPEPEPKPLNIRVVTVNGLVEHAAEAARADATYLNTLRATLLDEIDDEKAVVLLLAWRQHHPPMEVE